MDNVAAALELTRRQMNKEVIYPEELLVKFNLKEHFDQDNLSYLKNVTIKEGVVSGGYFHYLTLLARNTNAQLILELGNRYGVSTIALYHGLKPEQRLISLDIVKDLRYVPDRIFKDDRVKFIFGDCVDLSCFTKSTGAIPTDIDIFWTDTVHYYEQIQAEFRVYEPLLSDEALIVIDDIKLNDKGKFFDELPYEKYDLSDVCHSSGFGVIHYVRPMDQRGLSPQERINMALERAVGIMTARYWTIFDEYEAYKAKVQARSLSYLLRKALKPAYGALKKMFAHDRR